VKHGILRSDLFEPRARPSPSIRLCVRQSGLCPGMRTSGRRKKFPCLVDRRFFAGGTDVFKALALFGRNREWGVGALSCGVLASFDSPGVVQGMKLRKGSWRPNYGWLEPEGSRKCDRSYVRSVRHDPNVERPESFCSPALFLFGLASREQIHKTWGLRWQGLDSRITIAPPDPKSTVQRTLQLQYRLDLSATAITAPTSLNPASLTRPCTWAWRGGISLVASMPPNGERDL